MSSKYFVIKRGFHMIYVVSTLDDRPCKIGVATNVRDRFSNIQVSNWVDLKLYAYWYMAGKEITNRVESAVKKRLSGQHLRGEWYDIVARTMVEAVLDEAESINAWILTSAEIHQQAEAYLAQGPRSSNGLSLVGRG